MLNSVAWGGGGVNSSDSRRDVPVTPSVSGRFEIVKCVV